MGATKLKTISITGHQMDYVLSNYGKIPVKQVAKTLNMSYDKLRGNLYLMDVIKPRKDFDKLVPDYVWEGGEIEETNLTARMEDEGNEGYPD